MICLNLNKREDPLIQCNIIHIVSGDEEAKSWLEPEIELAKNYKYSRKQLKEIEAEIEAYYNDFISTRGQKC
jgi:hypothetical protein